jgi:hypothetical protein
MIRTQVYLPEDDIDFLKGLARVNKSTMSDELRKAIYVIKADVVDKKENYAQKLLKIKGGWYKVGEMEDVRKELNKGLANLE